MKTLIASILSENMVQATEAFDQLLSDKIAVTIAEAKIEVAQNLFGGQLDEAKNPKIDLYHNGVYKVSTTRSPTVKHAVAGYKAAYPDLDGEIKGAKAVKESFELDNYSMEELLDFVVSEDFDRLDELSKKTLGSYIRKASSDRAHSTRSAGVEMSGGGPKRRENIDKHEFHAEKRAVGISKAVDKLTKESIELDEARKPSFIAGTRKIASFDGDGGHTAEVRYSPEYSEYQVHHYKNGEHQGEGPISYHGDDKEDAMSNAKHETGC